MAKTSYIVVIGGRESGTGAALLAQQEGYEVFLSEYGTIPQSYKDELEEYGIPWEEGGHTFEEITKADTIVKSPGIPNESPVIQHIEEKGIPMISDIEWAAQHTDATLVGITGSNGKSTCTALTYEILNHGGLNVGIAGNIGNSFAREVAFNPKDYYVIEVSSFQLEHIQQFKPHISILLNLTPDHLNRYQNDFQKYIDTKFKITQNQQEQDYFIYCADDQQIEQNLTTHSINSQKIPFSTKKKFYQHRSPPNSYGAIKDDQIFIQHKKTQFTMTISEVGLNGQHNTYNSMAAAIVANIFDINKDNIRESLKNFKNLEHRLETVSKVHGIEFINDSKATNVNSTWYALETMDRPVIWIAGGVDKGNDYSILKPLVKEKVKAIICLGKDNRNIHHAFSKQVDAIVNTDNAQEAVQAAYHLGEKGDIVLLSPACASFDLFENFADRGRQFKEAVKQL